MPKREKTKEEKQRIKEKSSSLSQEEVNSLEQVVENDEEKIDLTELKEFLKESQGNNEGARRREKSSQASSPSLKKINAPQNTQINLETNLAESSISNSKNDEEDSFKYIVGEGGKQGKEAKYVKYEGSAIENIIPRGQIQNLGMGKPFEKREVMFETPPEARISAQESLEKYTPIKNVDREKIGKEDPFKRKEIKYTPSERY